MSGQTFSQREMIDRLVGFPTVSCDSNLHLIEFVKEYLASWGIESHLVFNSEKNKVTVSESSSKHPIYSLMVWELRGILTSTTYYLSQKDLLQNGNFQ